MTIKRPLIWLAACLLLLLGGVAWISATVLRLEAAEARARRQAALEESARLALWRLDSDVAPLLQRESSRPPAGFLAEGGDSDELILLRFEVDPDGQVRSPSAAARLGRLRGFISRPTLVDSLGATERMAKRADDENKQSVEYQKRSRTVTWAQNAAPVELINPKELRQEAMRPVWVGSELLLLRRVLVGGGDIVQGVWLDWPALRRTLLVDVVDLFPGAALEAAGPRDAGERRLASLPVRLVPGEPAAAPGPGGAPVGLVLGGAWAAVLVAAAAMALLFFGTLALSERRAAFVSAVTHELRTPLTTLRTYTEMLAGGMVREEKRPGYLATLSREAERLARLVDNVLLYARLERPRGPARQKDVDCARLLDEIRPRLEERAAAAGMTVAIEGGAGITLRGDPVAVEQVLFNLVDNACKYGAGEVRVSATAEGRDAVLRVADGGAGIAAEDRRWLFEPFARSAERAAGSAPGVGLGLALCRRLARAMGGDLTLEEGAGARFALRLRRSKMAG